MPVAGSVGTTSENITHFTAIRMRVYGTGNVKMKLYSLDEVNEQTLVPMPLSTTTNREPTRLCNFNEQRAQIELRTTEINEKMTITRILVFARPLFTDYPA
jgi:hypothetical protein